MNTQFEKLSAPELINSAFSMEVNEGVLLYSGMSLADLAHAIMLIEIDVIPKKARKELLKTLVEMHHLKPEKIDFNNALMDVYMNRNYMLKQRSPETAGWLQAGRSRREVSTLAYLIVTRTELLEVLRTLLILMETLLDFAEEHKATLLPDYTYLQRAHPTSLAHYVLTFVQPMSRDLDRLKSAFYRTNKSPAGSGSTNGSRLPLDRKRLAELLNFEGLIVHARDAMWQSDGPIELMSVAVALLCNVDRFSEDLQIWATSEFNFVELSDSHSRPSIIMPHKKNPYSLAFIRGTAREMVGRLTSTVVLQATPSGQVDNRIFSYSMVPKSLTETKKCLSLLSSTISDLIIHKDAMKEAVSEGFGGTTDLAEEIMIQHNIDASTAHLIIGNAVTSAKKMGKQLTAGLVNNAAKDLLDSSFKISRDQIKKITDAESIVATRTGLGGASEKSVQEMIITLRNIAEKHKKWCHSTLSELNKTEEILLQKVRELCQ